MENLDELALQLDELESQSHISHSPLHPGRNRTHSHTMSTFGTIVHDRPQYGADAHSGGFRSPSPSSTASSNPKELPRAPNSKASTKASSLAPYTPSEVEDQIALSAAYRAIHQDARKSPEPHPALYSICRTFTPKTSNLGKDYTILLHLTSKLISLLRLRTHLFLVAPSNPPLGPAPVILLSSSQEMLDKAVVFIQARFGDRILPLPTTLAQRVKVSSSSPIWLGSIDNLDYGSPYDEQALWNILLKSTNLTPPTEPPPGSISIDEMLHQARTKLTRLSPRDAYMEATHGLGAFLIDIRPESQRASSGGIPRALVIERNVLEWRFDPRSKSRLPIADRYDIRIIIFCEEGYTSSLAAAALQDLGLQYATDIVGGYQAWLKDGLPTTRMRVSDF